MGLTVTGLAACDRVEQAQEETEAQVEQAWEQLEVGGIIHNDVPTWRTDPMPYGGVKASGVGREGPAYTYRELTEERLLVVSR